MSGRSAFQADMLKLNRQIKDRQFALLEIRRGKAIKRKRA